MGGSILPRRFSRILLATGCVTCATAVVVAAVPAEVSGVGFGDPTTLNWSPAAGADTYNVYRGLISQLPDGVPGKCHGFEIGSTSFDSDPVPDPGEGFFYLVTGESAIDGEGLPPGTDSQSLPRAVLGSCRAVMRTHVLDRTGYGWNEWTRDRIESMGIEGYIDDQLAPRFISELDNDDLNNRLVGITPPVDIFQLLRHQIIRGVYARRQLEQQYTNFWVNHFNTYWGKTAEIYQGAFPPCQSPGDPPQCDEFYPAKAYQVSTEHHYDEMEKFRRMAFNDSFRAIVEVSALNPAMIIFLDTYASVAGNPNENYPRELLELYTMGVDGGYTQTDVEELSRIITGWTICKKLLDDINDPLAPCLSAYWLDEPAGKIVATYVTELHDCTEKTMFLGTPQEFTVPDTCADPVQGVNDLYIALDHIVAHPSTPRYISTKILQRFVTDTPDQAMIDALVAVWNDAGNPAGVGDLTAVLEAALDLGEFMSPDRVASKVKTPVEHAISAIRAVRGMTNGSSEATNFIIRTGEIPHYNPVPTGWPEDGESWINSNNMLDRQNYGFALAESPFVTFGSDPIALLNDNGVSTGPGNSEAIVEFFADVLYGGALTPAERQQAIDYLETDDLGNPDPLYDDARIRDVVGLLLGYPQFQEQ